MPVEPSSNTPLLDSVASPADLKRIPEARLAELAAELRAETIDAHLWTYRDDSFRPHGTWRESDVATQPIVLTGLADNVTRHFWLRAVDSSGNRSAWTARVQGTTAGAASGRQLTAPAPDHPSIDRRSRCPSHRPMG